MNDCTENTQYFDFEDFDDHTISAQVYKTSHEISEKDIETDVELEHEDPSNEPLWSIDDDTLFHPLGLINHGTEIGKSVFVTWNEIYIQNFIFKKSKKTKKINMTKVRLTLPPSEEIKEILILEYNTLLLMYSGNVYYFSSVKSMHAISWLSGIRCISIAPEGFSVIRVLEDKSISLELYRDVAGIGKSSSTLICSYDITFDAVNLFSCEWLDERFTLLSQIVEAEHINFMETLVRGACKFKPKDLIHIFTVSGNVFALIAESPKEDSKSSDEYHIELLNTYATPIEIIKVDVARQICVIFLQCGTIDIWYISSSLKVLQRTSHHTGSSFAHYDYNALNAIFYYTDTDKVGQLEFKYDAQNDLYLVQETFKAIPDIIVCSWVDKIQQLICLNSNNIFHRLSFAPSDAPPSIEPNPEFENFEELYVLTKSKMSKLLAKANFTDELVKIPAKIHEQIEKEYLKQQLISVASKKELYKRLLKGNIKFSRDHQATTDSETLVLYAQSNLKFQENTLFALINISIKTNSIFKSNLWHIHLDTQKKVYSFLLPKNFEKQKLCLVVPLLYSSFETFPVFHLKLLTFLSNDSNNYVAILLPIDCKYDSSSFIKLFGIHNPYVSVYNRFNLKTLIGSFNKDHKSFQMKPSSIACTLSLPKRFKFKDILKIFNHRKNILEDQEGFSLYFMSTLVKILYIDDSNSIQLESSCPIAVYYTKLFLIFYIQESLDEINFVEDKPSSSKRALLFTQYQCEVERCYGSLIETDSEELTSESTTFHFENLKRIYKKLRSTPLTFFN